MLANDARARALGDGAEPISPIIAHPDVARMLMSMKAMTAAARAICCMTAHAIDLSHRAEDAEQRRTASERASLLTPVAKAFSTDIGNEVASLGVQVHGGVGFIEETGAAQSCATRGSPPFMKEPTGFRRSTSHSVNCLFRAARR